jgi:twitching motility protein PilT
MVMNGPIGETILDGKHFERIESLIADGEYYGMQTFDQSLVALYRRGLIERDAALAHASSAPTLRLQLEAADRDRMSGVSAPPPPRVGAGLPGPAASMPPPPPMSAPVDPERYAVPSGPGAYPPPPPG